MLRHDETIKVKISKNIWYEIEGLLVRKDDG